MPNAAPKICAHPGCQSLVNKGRCDRHKRESRQQADKQRGNSASRGYDRKWRKARLAYLRLNPLCVRCKDTGQITAADVVDHITPHKGDKSLFWDVNNWQSLCKQCHDLKTATEDGAFGH